MDGRQLSFQRTRVAAQAGRHRLPPLRGLIVEVRNVLYDDTAWNRWLLRLVTRMGLHTHYATFFHVWETEYLVEVHQGRRDYWDALARFLRSMGLTNRQVQEVRAAGEGQRRRLEEPLRPFPGVVPTISSLCDRGVRMIAWLGAEDSESTRQRLQAWGIADHFVAICQQTTATCGPAGQREQQRYCDCLESLDLCAEEGVGLISCHPLELRAAGRRGLRTIAFNTIGRGKVDLELEQFADLPALIAPSTPLRRVA